MRSYLTIRKFVAVVIYGDDVVTCNMYRRRFLFCYSHIFTDQWSPEDFDHMFLWFRNNGLPARAAVTSIVSPMAADRITEIHLIFYKS